MALHRIFVYGTLKRGEPNHDWLTDSRNGMATFVGQAKTVDRWPLVIASEYNVPFLMNHKGKGKAIYGEIYDVDDSMLAALDILEAYPTLYDRMKHDVDIVVQDENGNKCLAPPSVDDSRHSCYIYVLRKFKSEMLERPYIDDYSSYGPHGLRYMKHDELTDSANI